MISDKKETASDGRTGKRTHLPLGLQDGARRVSLHRYSRLEAPRPYSGRLRLFLVLDARRRQKGQHLGPNRKRFRQGRVFLPAQRGGMARHCRPHLALEDGLQSLWRAALVLLPRLRPKSGKALSPRTPLPLPTLLAAALRKPAGDRP